MSHPKEKRLAKMPQEKRWRVEKMAISEEKKRVAITMPKWVADAIKKEASLTGLTMSQYVTLTMVANSFTVDGRAADLAANQIQVARDIAWGYEVDEFQKSIPKLID